jgi:two-component system chemotaxis response regulator CheV
VLKVRELVQRIPTVSIPQSPPSVEGSFKLRDEIITLINLSTELGIERDPSVEGLIIIIELNETRCGILVDAVEMIHRVSWEQIEPPSPTLVDSGTPVTAVAKVNERVVLVLDFESIVGRLMGMGGAAVPDPTAAQQTERQDARLLVVDDSPIVRETMKRLLNNAGFKHITICSDGEHAWQTITKTLENGNDRFDIILSDIEMPRMDGLTLTSRIKKEPGLAHTHVVLVSSLISEDTVNKGKAVGADVQIAKSDTEGLIAALDCCL